MNEEDINKGQADDVMRGVIYAVIAFFLLAVMSACAKMLSGTHHVIEVAFYRNFIPLVPFVAYILIFKKYETLKTRKPGIVFLRVIVGTVGMFVTFAAWKYLPLSEATVIFFTATLLAPALAFFLLKEHIGMHRWMAIFIGFAGVLFIVQPSAGQSLMGVGLAFAAALFHACIHIILRVLKTESHVMTTFYFLLGASLIGGAFMPFLAVPLVGVEWALVFGLGASGGIAQLFLSASYKYAPVSLLAPFHYTALLWATGLDFVIWAHMPGWPVFAGAGIIIAAQSYILYREKKAAGRVRFIEGGGL